MRRKVEESLLAWKKKESGRMPLLVNGARQVAHLEIIQIKATWPDSIIFGLGFGNTF